MHNYTPKIPKTELVHGAYYSGRCRNASVARWNADRQIFIHWRTKYGQRFVEEIRAPEDDACFDVFVAEKLVEPTEKNTSLRSIHYRVVDHFGDISTSTSPRRTNYAHRVQES